MSVIDNIRKIRRFRKKKLLLSLLIITCLVVAAWTAYVLFTHKTNPIWGTVIFLADIGVLIWSMRLLRSRHYRREKPSFKLVFFSSLGIFLVCAFAGIQPLAAYKDNAIGVVKEGVVCRLTSLGVAKPKVIDAQIFGMGYLTREEIGFTRVSSEAVEIGVDCRPVGVEPNKVYFISIKTKEGGEVIGTGEISWSKNELEMSNSNKSISIIVSSSQIPLMVDEYQNLINEIREKRVERDYRILTHGMSEEDYKIMTGVKPDPLVVTFSDGTKIADKYVKVIIAGEKSG